MTDDPTKERKRKSEVTESTWKRCKHTYKSESMMAQGTEHAHQLSIKMNRAFNNIGVNEEIIKMRRNCNLQIECNETAIKKADGVVQERVFIFGSQSEGTTTLGLQSDTDTVLLAGIVLVRQNIEDLSTVSGDLDVFRLCNSSNPGYCFLYHFRRSSSLGLYFGIYYQENTRYLKNSFTFTKNWYGKTPKMEGPAIYHETRTGKSINLVWGFPCAAWPLGATEEFLSNQRRRTWPSNDLVDQILKSECFVVAKGSDIGENSDIEWRLSFSCGERLLMFGLNVVQIRCYILMKYIKTTFLDRIADCKGVVSSYICKTVLFHVISQTQNCVWIEEELLTNLNHCLGELRKYIHERNCPHFIMPSLNLFLGRKLNDLKCKLLSDELQRITATNGDALFHIRIDDFGDKLSVSEQNIKHIDIDIRYEILKHVCLEIVWHLGVFWRQSVHEYFQLLSTSSTTFVVAEVRHRIARLIKYSKYINNKEQRMVDAVKVKTCRLSSMLGSIMACNDFRQYRGLSHEAFQWLLLSVQCSDAASSYLKFASIMFTDGDLECTEIILHDVEKVMVDKPFVPHCACGQYSSPVVHRSYEILDMFSTKSFPRILRDNIRYCITFLPAEILCCPMELCYEMYRTTFCHQQSLTALQPDFKTWLYCAVIPPEPFLYFMQYKLYKQRCMPVKIKKSLRKLGDIALGLTPGEYTHRETTLNLVAQCWEQEGYAILAYDAYKLSLTLQPNFNAARILLCCHLYKQFTLRNLLNERYACTSDAR